MRNLGVFDHFSHDNYLMSARRSNLLQINLQEVLSGVGARHIRRGALPGAERRCGTSLRRYTAA